MVQSREARKSDLELIFSIGKLSPSAKLLILLHDHIFLPQWLLLSAFIFSQLQIFSICIKTAQLSLPENSPVLSQISDTFHDTVSLIASLNLSEFGRLLEIILVFTCFYFITVISLLIYSLRTLSKSKFPSEEVKKLWTISISLHPNLLFYPIHLLSLRLIFSSSFDRQETASPKQPYDVFIECCSYFSLVLNFFYTVGILKCLSTSIKKPHILSTKSTLSSLQDIGLKFIIPFFWLTNLELKTYGIILLLINLAFSITRDWTFFDQLPFYNVNILRLSAGIQGSITLFALICSTSKIISLLGPKESLQTVLTFWLVLFLLIIRVYSSHLDKILHKILFLSSSSKTRPYHLVHYWYIFKKLTPKIEHRKTNKEFFYYLSFMLNSFHKKAIEIQQTKHRSSIISSIRDSHAVLELERSICKFSTDLLETSTVYYPKYSYLVNTVKAAQYLKFPKSFGVANQIIKDGLKSSSLIERITFSLLQLKLLRKLNKNNVNDRPSEDKSLSIKHYLHLHQLFQGMRQKIKEQVDYQIKFWEVFQAPKFDFDSLISLANMTNKKSREIIQYNSMCDFFEQSCFWEPILILGLYLFYIQNDSIQGKKLIQRYYNLKMRVKMNLVPASVRDKHHKMTDSIYFMVSSSPKEAGKILRFSKNAEKVLRVYKESLLGQSINNFAPNLGWKKSGHILGISIEDLPFRSWDNSKEIYIVDGAGYLVCCKMSVSLEFLTEIGLNYLTLLQPIIDVTIRVVLFKPNGRVVHLSRTFGEDMYLEGRGDKVELNIFSFCPGLEEIVLHMLDNHMQRKNETKKSIRLEHENKVFDQEYELKKDFNGSSYHFEEKELVFYPFSNGDLRENTLLSSEESRDALRPTCSIIYQAKIQFIHPSIESNEFVIEIKLKKLSIIDLKANHSNFELTTEPWGTKLSPTFRTTSIVTLMHERRAPTTPESAFSSNQIGFRQLTSSPLLQNKAKAEKTWTTFKGRHQTKFVTRIKTKNVNAYILEDSASSMQNYLSEDPFEKLDIQENQNEKIVQKILETKFHAKSRKSYSFYFFFIISLVLACLLWYSFNINTISYRVENISNSKQYLYMRCFWTNLANQETRLWTAVRAELVNIPGIVDAEVEQETTNLTFHKMNEFNRKLWESIKDIDNEVQTALNEKRVRVFERDSDNQFNVISYENTFQVVSQIISNGFKNVYKKPLDAPLKEYIEKESRFIFDNSHNDLLIESERLLNIMIEKMEKIFSDAGWINILVLCIGATASIVFILISSYFIVRVYKEFCRFMNIFFTVPQEEAIEAQLHLSLFKDVLDREYEGMKCIEALNIPINRPNINTNSQDQKLKLRRRTKIGYKLNINQKALTSNIQQKNFYLFLRIVVVQMVVLISIVFYYCWSVERINTMQRQQSTIDSALKNINLQSMVSVELQTFIMDNSTSTIRNVGVLTSLNNDVQEISQISDLEKSFRNNGGELSQKQSEIFLDYNCYEVYSSLYLIPSSITIEECNTLSTGKGKIGLIKTNLEMMSELSVFISSFEASERDIETLKTKYKQAIEKFIRYIDVSIVLFLLSYETTQTDFNNLLLDLKYHGTIFAWAAISFIILVGTLSWMVSTRHITSKKFDPKEVLTLVPPKIILANNYIKRYIASATDS